MNRKGNIQDIGFGMAVVFVFALVAVIVGTIFADINTGFQDSGVISTQGKEFVSVNEARYTGLFDGLTAFAMVGIVVGILGLAFLIRTNPAFAILGLFIVGLFVIVSAILSNSFIGLTSQPALVGEATDFTITTFILGNFPIIITAMAFIVSIIFYTKSQFGAS